MGSLFNEDAFDEEWRGADVRRTLASDAAQFAAFSAGTRNLSAAWCSTAPIMHMPRGHVLICILHCVMAVGRLFAGFIDREAHQLGKGVSHHV